MSSRCAEIVSVPACPVAALVPPNAPFSNKAVMVTRLASAGSAALTLPRQTAAPCHATLNFRNHHNRSDTCPCLGV